MLTTAFNWLQTQPESVRKMATSPDSLVCLYTRAQRMGSVALDSDAPVSSQNFMSDLKNLAEGLRQFDGPATPQAAQPTPVRAPRATPISAQTSSQMVQQPLSAQPTPKATQPSAQHSAQRFAGAQVTPLHPPVTIEEHQFFEQHQPTQTHLSATAATSMADGIGLTMLNERSLAMIQEVKAGLNLSSDSEVANLMVALAYKSLKNLLA
jgi:hypothetical protein